jgi:hypothetical protein
MMVGTNIKNLGKNLQETPITQVMSGEGGAASISQKQAFA